MLDRLQLGVAGVVVKGRDTARHVGDLDERATGSLIP